ncbi:MAG: esterase-like activity of phytase family protein [Janthinobacterium lividum]
MSGVLGKAQYAVILTGLACAVGTHAQVKLLAKGTLTGSSAGNYTDLSGLNGTLENGVSASLLGGLGSGLAYVSGDRFLAVPDRGPNAVPFNSAVDDTDSYINRFHTIEMNLQPSPAGSALPYSIAPTLEKTTLLSSQTPLVYGTGAGLGIGTGVPPANYYSQFYFTGRSDNFDPAQNSGNPVDGRLDPESIRLSNDGMSVFISDEYGPYIYQFNRFKGTRIRSYALPAKFYVSNLSPNGATEISGNTTGRTANKGLEGLAITPDGKTLISMIQAPLIQDANLGGAAANLLRFVTIDVTSGATHEYAYSLTTGSGVSEIVALNNHEILVDERDGKGLGDGSKAKIKQVFKVDFAGATDVSNMDGVSAASHSVAKTLFLDLVTVLTANGYTTSTIPAKIEGMAFGPDVTRNGISTHTLWVSNDNDFLQDYGGVTNSNPNQFFVFGFTDADLQGSVFVPQTRTGT